MPDRRILRALLWKELRSWWHLAAMLAGIPPLLFAAASAFPQGSNLRDLPYYSGVFLFSVLLVYWGATKPVDEKNAADFADTNLPVKPHARWLASFAMPVLAVAAIGAWYGLWRSMLPEWRGATAISAEAPLAALCAFGVSYLLSTVLSRWPAMLIGIWSVAPAALTFRTAETARANAKDLALLLAAAVAGVLLFELVLRRWPLRQRQAVALVVPVAAFWLAIYVSLPQEERAFGSKPTECTKHRPARIDSSDWSKSAGPIQQKLGPQVMLEFCNYRTNAYVRRRFKNAVDPIDFVGEDRVFLIQRLPNEARARLLEWHTEANRVRAVAVLPAAKFDLANQRYQRGFVRTDGRYAVVSLPSMAGRGRDLWVVDLSNGTGVIAAPNASCATDAIRWIGSTAVLYGRGTPMRIDLKSVSAQPIRFVAEGVQ